MSSIKVFIDARCLVRDNPSGVGHYVASILRSVDEQLDELHAPKNIRYHLIVPFRRAARIDDYQFRNFKIRKIYLPLRVMNVLSRKRLLPPLDLIFGKGVYVFPEFIRLPLLFSKSVTLQYDAAYSLLPNSVERKMRSFIENNIEQTVKKSTRLVTISKSAQKDLAKANNIPPSKYTIISPSVDQSVFYPRSAKEINVVRARYELFDDYILAVGNFEPRKNLTSLFDAYALLPQTLTDKLCLLVVGASTWNNEELYRTQGQYKEKGLRIITRLGAITDQDLPAIYSGARLFAYPTLYEGFGMPILEAMASGTPVACGTNSSLPEASGKAASTFDEKDPQSVADTIERTLENKNALFLRSEGFRHIDNFQTWGQAAEKFQTLIIECQSKKPEYLK